MLESNPEFPALGAVSLLRSHNSNSLVIPVYMPVVDFRMA